MEEQKCYVCGEYPDIGELILRTTDRSYNPPEIKVYHRRCYKISVLSDVYWPINQSKEKERVQLDG